MDHVSLLLIKLNGGMSKDESDWRTQEAGAEAGLSEGAQNTKAELFWALLLFGMGTGLEWGS